MKPRQGRTRWAAEAGKGRIRNLATLALVVVAIYAGLKFVPVRAAAFQLDDAVREQVVYAGSRRRQVGDEEIRRAIARRAEELGLPVDERSVAINRTRDDIRVSVRYTVRIEFPMGMHYDWAFESTHEGPSF